MGTSQHVLQNRGRLDELRVLETTAHPDSGSPRDRHSQDGAPIDPDVSPSTSTSVTCDRVQQRCLACAVWPDDGNDFICGNLCGYIKECMDAAEPYSEILNLQEF